MSRPTQVGRRHRLLTAAAVVAAVLGAALILGVVINDQPAPGAAPDFRSTESTDPDPAATRAGSPTASSSSPPPSPAGDAASASASERPRRESEPSRSAQSKQPASGDTGGVSALDEARPRRIEIPSIGVSAGFVDLGLGSQGELETPTDPADVGWFVGSRSPGGPGPSVVAGHVTWDGAESVFFDLGDLSAGDRVRVHRADGSTAVFAVTARDTFPKDEFPTDQVYTGSHSPELVMITCGGDYDADQHYYDANVIVRAKLVGHRN
jgi:sortase (surface protein transpeptidase)